MSFTSVLGIETISKITLIHMFISKLVLTLNMNDSSNEAGLSTGLNFGAAPPITWKRLNIIRPPKTARKSCRHRNGLKACSRETACSR